MDRVEEDLPPSAIPLFELDRGQEAVFVKEDLSIGSWRAPYCGPKKLITPKFRATKARLAELEAELRARAPLGSQVRVLRCSGPDANGVQEWTAHIAIEASSYNVGD